MADNLYEYEEQLEEVYCSPIEVEVTDYENLPDEVKVQIVAGLQVGGQGTPNGGKAGDILVKNSDKDHDVKWTKSIDAELTIKKVSIVEDPKDENDVVRVKELNSLQDKVKKALDLNLENGSESGSLRQLINTDDKRNPKALGIASVALAGCPYNENLDELQGSWLFNKVITNVLSSSNANFVKYFNFRTKLDTNEFIDCIGINIHDVFYGYEPLSGEWALNTTINFLPTGTLLSGAFISFANLFSGILFKEYATHGNTLYFVQNNTELPIMSQDGFIHNSDFLRIYDISNTSSEFETWVLSNCTRVFTQPKQRTIYISYITGELDNPATYKTHDVYYYGLSEIGGVYEASKWYYERARKIYITSKQSSVDESSQLLTILNNNAIKVLSDQHVHDFAADGNQAMTIGAATRAAGDWSFAGGNGSVAWQNETFSFGGKCQAGMNRLEFDEYWGIKIPITESRIIVDFELKNASIYCEYDKDIELWCNIYGGTTITKSANSAELYITSAYDKVTFELLTQDIVEINDKQYVHYVFSDKYFITKQDKATGEYYVITSTISSNETVWVYRGDVYQFTNKVYTVPQYLGLRISFTEYDEATKTVHYSDGTSYSLLAAAEIPVRDASGNLWEDSYSFAVAFGEANHAQGRAGFSTGSNNDNFGDYSFVGGKQSLLTKEAYQSFLYGFQCSSTAYDTINIGDKNNIHSRFGIALGILNEIPKSENGKYYYGNTLLGYGHKATGSYQTLLGRYSDSNGMLLAVGNGSSDTARNNIFSVSTKGEVYVAGKPTLLNHAVRLQELSDLQSSFNESINIINSKLVSNIKTSGNNGILGGDIGNPAKAYVNSYGGVGLGIRPKVESGATGAVAIGIDANVTGYAGIVMGDHVTGGRYDVVLGKNSTSTQKSGFWYNILLGADLNTDYSSTTLIGRNHTATSSYQTLMGSYTDTTNNPVFAYGVGTSSPKNAFEVLQDRRMKVYGAPTQDDDVVRLQDLNNIVGNIETILKTI